mmetsp:Transcript_31040/g.38928  ORF Transcript_31040/g.38928 Transcript_31040/m.38928 type:complete len:538 (+) Transcript_31040:234-1847(+)
MRSRKERSGLKLRGRGSSSKPREEEEAGNDGSDDENPTSSPEEDPVETSKPRKKRFLNFPKGRKKQEETKEDPDDSVPSPQKPSKKKKEKGKNKKTKASDEDSEESDKSQREKSDGSANKAANERDGKDTGKQLEEGQTTPSPRQSARSERSSSRATRRRRTSTAKKQKRLKFETGGSDSGEEYDSSSQLIPVQKEDIKGLPIHYSQMPRFIQVDFKDGTGPPVEEPNASLVNMGAITASAEEVAVYIESSTTGRFFRVMRGERGVKALRERLKKKRQELLEKRRKNISSQERAQVQATILFQVLDTCFLVVQGALAGFSLTTMYYSYAAGDATKFITEYDDLANEVRRLMYVLSMIAFTGAWEGFLRRRSEKASWKKRTRRDRMEWRATTLCYSLVLISTLVCSLTDIRIFYHDSITDEEGDWIELAMSDPDFVQSLDTWYIFNVIRFLGCIIGWVLVCRDRHRESIKGYHSRQEAGRLLDEAIDLKERVNHLSGKFLEKLPKEELLKILALQKKAVEQTERTIDIQIRRELDKIL